jgi:hypothetical protein
MKMKALPNSRTIMAELTSNLNSERNEIMPNLFCAKCAQRHWDDKRTYEGEMTLLSKGPLVAVNCLCNSCNAPISIESEACLMECMLILSCRNTRMQLLIFS